MRAWWLESRTDLGPRGLRIATGLAACIAALGVLGAIDAMPSVHLQAFDLGGESSGVAAINVPATFSAAILVCAAASAFSIAGRSESVPWVPIGAFLAFMGLDELLTIHEVLERELAIDWQVLYLPLICIGGVYWLITLRRMRDIDTAAKMWLGGATAWVVAQALELVANARSDTWVGLTTALSTGEELLEMIGSSLFLLALLVVARRTQAADGRLGGHHVRA